ncbi:hypothetical protein [Streptomyces mobaraensis]|uniref:Uncharacterized protein n=1 Tax=Streptomyces mobaraensis TaxID=35621 RepID=A0A5N5VX72_STRMB|nr:hypothetical protein [Streptomyces mobaraensis]KAB7833454.1 hypothetical protein FRZ00_33785 [Streptomyces mobaraensis]
MRSPASALHRRFLLDSLTILAADAPAQTAWLDRHGVPPDEIALTFDDAFRMTATLIADGHLGPDALPALREIDSALAGMSGAENADNWTKEALSTTGWHRARRAARRILVAELGTWQRPLPHLPER